MCARFKRAARRISRPARPRHRTRRPPTGTTAPGGGPARRLWAYLRRAPGTFLWLTILLVTSVIMHRFSPDVLTGFLQQRSTNIHNLLHSPARVLLTSALWLDGGGWPLYFVLYNAVHVPAERWLGTRRWLTVLGTAHIGATYLSEGVLAVAIHTGAAPHTAVNTLDVGVSYALAGVAAVLTYRLTGPWRYAYALGILAFYGAPLLTGRGFTDVGHFAAALIGFACRPLTHGASGTTGRPGTTAPAADTGASTATGAPGNARGSTRRSNALRAAGPGPVTPLPHRAPGIRHARRMT
ncbi:rhomboid-like protein [Streptomyces catenulae]|uniref:Rhomboid-like protein n=1 Tax=Streptomyces catenulae TaxID=66875 RepID=A0ABV2Z439_9ACTN|nr:rhomboid-like protein [Streptomyces catenulae]